MDGGRRRKGSGRGALFLPLRGRCRGRAERRTPPFCNRLSQRAPLQNKRFKLSSSTFAAGPLAQTLEGEAKRDARWI